MTKKMSKAEREFSLDGYPYSPPAPRRYGLQSGLACWFCGNPELISLGFCSRAPYAPGGRKGYHHKERFLCPACGKCSVRVLHVARRRRIGRVTFETTEKGETLIIPIDEQMTLLDKVNEGALWTTQYFIRQGKKPPTKYFAKQDGKILLVLDYHSGDPLSDPLTDELKPRLICKHCQTLGLLTPTNKTDPPLPGGKNRRTRYYCYHCTRTTNAKIRSKTPADYGENLPIYVEDVEPEYPEITRRQYDD